ncbi:MULTISPECIES: MFS transporter [unclassified Streptomyces]|uniref:MFS transporter n=1 Tax=unclassified Streptomyces TaxID=2593676 RepID=UPI003814984B
MDATTEQPAPAGALGPARGRAAVLVVAATTFSVVTTEMLPVGLLSPVAAALHVSEGTAGLTVTLPGLVAAVTAPLLPALAGRTDRRSLLVALVLLLALADLVSALAPAFAVLLAARLVVGVCIGGVWAIAVGLGHRLVPEAAVGRATAVIFSGIAVASVIGVPAGALTGELAGRRWGFGFVGLVAVVVAGLLAALLPPLPAEAAVRPATSPRQAGEVVTALFSGVFNAAIALGAAAGGLVVDRAGEPGVLWLGGALATLALAVAAHAGLPEK